MVHLVYEGRSRLSALSSEHRHSNAEDENGRKSLLFAMVCDLPNLVGQLHNADLQMPTTSKKTKKMRYSRPSFLHLRICGDPKATILTWASVIQQEGEANRTLRTGSIHSAPHITLLF